MNVSTSIDIYSLSYPLDNSHVRRFGSLADQTASFDNYSKVSLRNHKYTRTDMYDFTIKVGSADANSSGAIDVSQATNWSYLRVNNFFKANKWVYAFIRQVVYNNNGGVELLCTVDFYQSFCFDIEILQSYVERQHEYLYQSNGLPYVNTLDEGLNYGLEYRTVYTQEVRLSDLYYLVIVATKQLGEGGDPLPQYIGVPTPLYYYVIPYVLGSNQSLQVTYNNITKNVPNVYQIFKELQGNEDYVNSIVSLYLTTNCGIAFNDVYSGGVINMSNSSQQFDPAGLYAESITVGAVEGSEGSGLDSYLIRVKDKPNFVTQTFNIDSKYTNVPNYVQSKLKLYPYTIIIISDMKGNQIEVKPEFLSGNNLSIAIEGSLGTQNKVKYYPANYKTYTAEAKEYSLIDENPNNIPIMTEATADYIQGNQNSINTKLALADSNRLVESGSAIVNALPMMFSPFTAGIGVANVATGIAGAENRRYNEIKTLQAKQQDINNIPPNAKNMAGNSAFEWGNGYALPQVFIKTVTDEYAKKLTDYFHMYGYQVNELMFPYQHNRQHFNFIKCAQLNVRTSLNRDIATRFKAIFENGVTLWHTDDIMNYNVANEVI